MPIHQLLLGLEKVNTFQTTPDVQLPVIVGKPIPKRQTHKQTVNHVSINNRSICQYVNMAASNDYFH